MSEAHSGGPLDGLAVTNAYDTYLRRTAVALNTQPSTLNTFGYNAASRLASVTNGNYNASYSYVANSPMVGQIVFKTNTTTRMTTTKTHDFLNRLTRISSVPGGTGVSPVSSGYQYNAANQRTRNTTADGSYWLYDYDSLGQVRSGKKYWSDQTPVAGQQFEYGFDDIGNRKSTKSGGDENGWNLRPANYSANNVKQYTQRDVPGYVDIKGLALATNTVTVNSLSTYRKGEYFRKELSVANGSASVWQSITVAAPTETTVTGNIYVPKTPEAFTHDADGNLTVDGRWNCSWDGENRLILMVANTANGPQQRIEFKYDWQGRRINKKVWNNTAGTGNPAVEQKFIYDGWNLLAILNPQSAILQSFTWGLDLSGTMQGAGGVGGLLSVNDAVNGVHFCAYDGNGNVAALLKADGSGVTAQYEYGPFGEVIRTTGAMAKANPFRFSTKYQDDETDLLYYGYRYLRDGRWPNTDPIGEEAFARFHPQYRTTKATRRKRAIPSLPAGLDYVFVRNGPLNSFDVLGLKQYDAAKGALGQGFGNYHNMAAGDTVINTTEVSLINVLSGNLEKSNDPDFAKAKCVLKEIKLPLPTSENGVYWGSWNDPNLNAVTVEWTGLAGSDINYTFIANSHQGASKKCDRRFIEFVVTLYHEVKGHSIDEASHDTAEEMDEFNKKYEDPVRDALLEEKIRKACCGVCKVGQ